MSFFQLLTTWKDQELMVLCYVNSVNTEGRVQMGNEITPPAGQAREQWEIFRALSEECGVSLPYNSLEELRARIYEIAPHLLKYDHIETSVYGKIATKEYGTNQ
jgi:NADH dehydrogenase (ubiquinone) Fe-S protein 1